MRLVVALVLATVAAPAAGQIPIVRPGDFPLPVTVDQLGAADGTKGLRRVTDDADCNVATADDGIVLCLDTGAAWELVTGGGGADTTCLDAGVDCLFAGSASEGGPATSALDLTCAGCVAASEVAADVATQAELDTVAGAETDDQDSTEVPYTPTTAGDWIDPDPTNVGEALDDLAASGGGPSAFADLTSGTNTTAAMVAGSGSSLKIAGTGTIDASGIDADGDGTRELTCTPGSATCTFAPAENSIEFRFQNFGGGSPWLQLYDGGNRAGIRTYSGLARATYNDGEAWAWGLGAMLSIRSAAGFWIDFSAATATNPVFVPNQSDKDTGVGHCGSDCLPFIAGGAPKLHVDDGGVVFNPSSVTCTDNATGASPGTVTIAPTTSAIHLTNADPDGCTPTMSESGATSVQTLKIFLVSNAGGMVDFADSAGILEAGAGCSLSLWGVVEMDYVNADRWIVSGCRASN